MVFGRTSLLINLEVHENTGRRLRDLLGHLDLQTKIYVLHALVDCARANDVDL